MNILAGCPRGGRPFSFGLPSDWRVTPAVITEAVWAAKQFLDEKLDKCETFQELESELNPGQAQKLFSGVPEEKVYSKVRSEGVGAILIVRLLGDGWERPVSEALSALQEDSARAQAERLRKRQEREAAFFLIRQFWGIKTV